MDYSDEIWIACHDSDARNTQLAEQIWQENGLDVVEKTGQSLLQYLSEFLTPRTLTLFGRILLDNCILLPLRPLVRFCAGRICKGDSPGSLAGGQPLARSHEQSERPIRRGGSGARARV